MDNYYNIPAISNSLLNIYEKSPLTAFKMLSGEIRQKDTEDMRLGRLFHKKMLQPDNLNEEFIIDNCIKPKSQQQHQFCNELLIKKSQDITNLYLGIYKEKDTKKAYENAIKMKEEFARYVEIQNEIITTGKTLVSKEEIALIDKMIDAVNKNMGIQKIFNNCSNGFQLIEFPLFFNYKPLDTKNEAPLQCKSKPDKIIIKFDKTSHTIDIIELKTCSHDVLEAFRREIFTRKYYRQLAFYEIALINANNLMDELKRQGARDIIHEDITDCDFNYYIIAVNKGPEIFDSVVYRIDNKCIINGTQEIYKLLKDIYYAKLNNWWEYPIEYYTKMGILDLVPSIYE